MSFAAATILEPVSMATNGCLISTPSLFTTSKILCSRPSLSIPYKPIRFKLSCKKITSLSAHFKNKEPFFRVCVEAAQEDHNPVILEEKEEDEQEFQGNLIWDESVNDVDSEKLAMLFQQAGVVEIAEDLRGRLLTCNIAAPRGSWPERPPQAFEPTYNIYVGNLPWNVDNGRLEQIFSEHGKSMTGNLEDHVVLAL